MNKVIRLTELLKEEEPKKGSTQFPGKFHLGGGYYSSKEGGEAEFKSDDGKLRPLTPDEKAARKAGGAQPKAEPKAQKPAQPAAQGAAAARAGAKPEQPKQAQQPAQPKAQKPAQPTQPAQPKAEKPAEKPMTPDDEKAHKEFEHEKEGLSHDEKEAYDFLDGIPDDKKAQAIDDALSNRTFWQKFTQDTMIGGFLKKKGKQFAETGKGIASFVRNRKLGVTQDCSGAPAGPHAKKTEGTLAEAPQDRQAYLGSLGKGGAPKVKSSEPADKSKCKKTHYTDYMKRDENGEPLYKEETKPVYKQGKRPDPGSKRNTFGGKFTQEDIDPKTGFYKSEGKLYDTNEKEVDANGNLLDSNGKPTQATNWRGKPKTQKVKEPVYEDNLTPEQLHAAHESHHASHEQAHAIQHTAIEAAVITAGVLTGGLVAGAGKAAYGISSTGEAAAHGFMEVAAHVVKDAAKHAALETLGVPDAYSAGAAGAGLTFATAGVLETRLRNEMLMILEAGENPNTNAAFMEKLVRGTLEKMKTFKMNPQQKLDSIRAYKDEKAESESSKKQKESIKESALTQNRIKEIANFVEYASKRLKLTERPKIKLVKEAEYLEKEIIRDGSSALGGYIPAEKTIMVVHDGRLIADVLRTIAHEMVHHKQNEIGALTDLDEAGKAGTKIENQANSIAGIILREYGKTNKKIYKESKMFFSETEEIGMAIKKELKQYKLK
jgi:hypothetical protein